jgi:nucleoside-diphosphate-sugar epimerase
MKATTNHSATADPGCIGVLGATSLVGRPLIDRLVARGDRVVACSRQTRSKAEGVTWCTPGTRDPIGEPVPRWITVCPLWTVPEHLPWLESLGIRSLVALSSTSMISKRESPDPDERAVAATLSNAEATLGTWAERSGATLCLLRPTMIYDGVNDLNVAAIATFIRRYGFFPVAGPASGLRQPVHAADVAAACVAALDHAPVPQALYTLSGPVPLPFRDVVAEVFVACGRTPRIVHVPRWAVSLLSPLARLAGRRGSMTGIAARMNEDLVFDHAAAARDLGFAPRPFASSSLFAEAKA